MRRLDRLAGWPIRMTMTPARATLGGTLLGGLVAVAAVAMPPRNWSMYEFQVLLGGLMLAGGLFGYAGYLTADTLRSARLFVISGRVALIANLALILASPGFLRSIGARDPMMALMFLGFVSSLAFFGTVTCFGIANLAAAWLGSARMGGKPPLPQGGCKLN